MIGGVWVPSCLNSWLARWVQTFVAKVLPVMCRCLGSQLHHALCGSARLCVCVCEPVVFVGRRYAPVWSASWRWPLTLLPGDYQGRRCDFPSSICRARGSCLAGRPSLAPGAALGSNVPIWGRRGRWRPGQLSRCPTIRTRLRVALLGGSLLCPEYNNTLANCNFTYLKDKNTQQHHRNSQHRCRESPYYFCCLLNLNNF